jgi:UDPglucose--hexose-1-phosphate uridylyltransferase
MIEMTKDYPHRRFNMLSGEWVLVSPHRTKRPWQGKVDKLLQSNRPKHDPKCYLCPGNLRAGGYKNPNYKQTFVFTNDFPALLPDLPTESEKKYGLFVHESVLGTCRVICFSPRHDLSLAEMSVQDIHSVIELWTEQVFELGGTYRWVQIFENKGDIMGCSNPHPHGQIWASNSIPNEPFKEDREQKAYHSKNKSVLLLDYLNKEIDYKNRIVVENEHWITVVPFWAVWPFETMLLPKRHVLRLTDLTDVERNSLAEILKNHLTRYDNLFETSFPYTMGLARCTDR